MSDGKQDVQRVWEFWFETLESRQWFQKSAALDRDIMKQFGELHRQACACELSDWRETPRGRLAEILVLDQFSRNIYRDSPKAFAQDALALALAQEAVRQGADQFLPPQERAFLYMPYMHSESRRIHGDAMRLFDQPGLENNLKFEVRHRDIIEQFGRYPHRNEVLGRDCTAEEQAFLKEPGSSF